jgi:hypothetical protein
LNDDRRGLADALDLDRQVDVVAVDDVEARHAEGDLDIGADALVEGQLVGPRWLMRARHD